jgi:hypothetical protein
MHWKNPEKTLDTVEGLGYIVNEIIFTITPWKISIKRESGGPKSSRNFHRRKRINQPTKHPKRGKNRTHPGYWNGQKRRKR